VSEWWNVLASVTQLNSWAQYLAIFFIFLSAAMTVLSVKTANRVAFLKEQKALAALHESDAKHEAIVKSLNQQLHDTGKRPVFTSQMLDEASKKADEAQLKVSGRALSKDQKDRLLAALSSNPKGVVTVTYLQNDPETQAFAHELMTAMASAGWKATDVGPTKDIGGIQGLHFQIKNIQNEPENAKYLIHSFIEVGLKPNTELNKTMPDNTLLLIVGHKS
jgi:cell division protein FtsB